MPTYKLTTDLIADCMALIPQNLGRLNKNQDKIKFRIEKIYYGKDDIRKELRFAILNKKHGDTFEELSSIYQEFCISRCLRTIPEFQEPNPKRLYILTKRSNSVTLMVGCYEYYDGILENLPETIGKATLFGNGTFPSTLEELCESYKNVMKK